MTDLEKAKAFFEKDVYAMGTTGISLDEVGERYAKCSLKVDSRHVNATGHVMGGAIFTLADFTFAVATNFNQSLTVTTVSNISFLGSPKGDTLISESRLIKDGKRSCFYEISVKDNLDNPVALVSVSGTHL